MSSDGCLALQYSLYWSITVAISFHGMCLLITGLFYRL